MQQIFLNKYWILSLNLWPQWEGTQNVLHVFCVCLLLVGDVFSLFLDSFGHFVCANFCPNLSLMYG